MGVGHEKRQAHWLARRGGSIEHLRRALPLHIVECRQAVQAMGERRTRGHVFHAFALVPYLMRMLLESLQNLCASSRRHWIPPWRVASCEGSYPLATACLISDSRYFAGLSPLPLTSQPQESLPCCNSPSIFTFLATIRPLTLYAPYSEVTTARSSTQGLRFHALIRRTQAFQRGNTVMPWAPHAVIRPQSASRSAPAARPWRRRHWQYSAV